MIIREFGITDFTVVNPSFTDIKPGYNVKSEIKDYATFFRYLLISTSNS